MKSILILAQAPSPRLSYILDFIFVDVLALSYDLIFDPLTFNLENDVPRISYGFMTDQGLQIASVDLLFENTIIHKSPKFITQNGQHKLFSSRSEACDFGFDIFAACFYLISRYEEYTAPYHDVHDRYQAKNSIAYKNKLLQVPLVDRWISKLQETLKNIYPTLVFKKQKFQIFPTFDIDQAFAFLHRSAMSNLLGGLNDLRQLKFSNWLLRIKVLKKELRDPFDTYDLIFKLIADNTARISRPIFFLLNKNKGKYDKANGWKHPKLRDLAKQLRDVGDIGLHPSYLSYQSIEQILNEKINLEKKLRITIKKSRFHYLKFNLPNSYKNLLDCGIVADYSMGYADQIGFRASTSRSFKWFDLAQNKCTNLTIFPFSIMDVSLRDYLQLSPEDALRAIKNLKSELIATQGNLQFIWHNSSMKSSKKWQDWDIVLQSLLCSN